MKKATGDYLTILKRVKAYRENLKRPLSAEDRAKIQATNKQ